MASSAGFAVVISATDKASQKIDAINKRLAAMRAPVERVQRSLNKFADLTGLNRLGRGMRDIARWGLEAFRSLGRIVPALGAITGAASIAGIVRLTSAWADFGAKLGFTATRIGLGVRQLHGLEGAARLAGASGESLASGMQALRDNLTNAVAGRAPATIAMMNALGIAWQNADGSARNVTEVLPQLADKIAAIKDPTLQARAATELFGGAGEDLLPFLRLGSAGIAEYNREAQRYGVMNTRGALAANELRRRQVGLSLAVEGLGYAVAQRLAPVLGPLLTQMADWIAANRDWIATGIGTKVGEFADYLKTIDWNAIGRGVQGFLTDVRDVVTALGGWKNATEILFGLWIGSKFLKVVANAALLIRTLGVVGLGGAATSGAGAATAGGIGAATVGALALPLALGGDTNNDPAAAEFYKNRGAPDNKGESFSQTWLGRKLHNLTTPRGIRNNNPLNLTYMPGQGAVGSDGRFGQYRTMQEGVAADYRQLLRYQDRDHLNTISGIVSKWAPPGENDTGAYIQYVAHRMNKAPNAPLDLHDQATAASLIAAMARHESGAVDQKVIAQGVRLGLGQPVNINGGTGSPASAAGEQTVRGSVDVNISHASPPGTKVTAMASGDAFSGPPKIVGAMAGAGP